MVWGSFVLCFGLVLGSAIVSGVWVSMWHCLGKYASFFSGTVYGLDKARESTRDQAWECRKPKQKIAGPGEGGG